MSVGQPLNDAAYFLLNKRTRKTGVIQGNASMNKIRMAALAVLVGLAGCQTAAIDGTQTTSIGKKIARPSSERDLGKEQFMDSNYGLAERHFRRAVEMRSDDAEAWMGLAAAYDELGRFDFADRAYEQLFKVAGRKPHAVSNYGYSFLLRGDKKKAVQLFNEAAAGLPNDARIMANQKLAASM
jgi:Flp pilus assembly protein TadD